MKTIIVILSLLSASTFATNKPTPVTPTPTSTTEAQAAAAAIAGAKSQSTATGGNAAGGHSNSRSAANGGDSSAGATGMGGQATGNGAVDIGGDQYESKALALALPGLVAAPAVPGECRIHKAGWGGFSAGKTGSTAFDLECMRQRECLERADRYAAWGRIDMALAQLKACGGVEIVPAPKTEVVQQDLSQYATKEQLDRAFKLAVSK